MAEKFVSVERLKRKLIDEKHFYPAIVAATLKEMSESDEDHIEVSKCNCCASCYKLTDDNVIGVKES